MRPRFTAAMVIGVVAVSVVWVASADTARPVRSGTILMGGGFPLGPPACGVSPYCRAWLESGCDERLVGLDPAVGTSIVDVRRLAGSWRRMVTVPEQSWVFKTNYEFWSGGCRLVGAHASDEGSSFRIPRRGRWMTIPSASPFLHWELW